MRPSFEVRLPIRVTISIIFNKDSITKKTYTSISLSGLNHKHNTQFKKAMKAMAALRAKKHTKNDTVQTEGATVHSQVIVKGLPTLGLCTVRS